MLLQASSPTKDQNFNRQHASIDSKSDHIKNSTVCRPFYQLRRHTNNVGMLMKNFKVCAPKDQEKVKKTSPLKQQTVEDYDEIVCIATGLRLQIRKKDTYDDHTVDFSKKSETCDTAESSIVVTRSNSGVTLGQVEHSFTFSFSDELSPPEGQEQKVPACPSASKPSSFHFRAVHRRLSSKVAPAVKQIDQDIKDELTGTNHLLNTDENARMSQRKLYCSSPEKIALHGALVVHPNNAVLNLKSSVGFVGSDTSDKEEHNSNKNKIAEKESSYRTPVNNNYHTEGILTHEDDVDHQGRLDAEFQAVGSIPKTSKREQVAFMVDECDNDAGTDDTWMSGAGMISLPVDCLYKNEIIEESSTRNIDNRDSSYSVETIGILGYPYTDSSPIPLSLWTSSDEYEEDDEAFRDHELALKKDQEHLRNLLDARFLHGL